MLEYFRTQLHRQLAGLITGPLMDLPPTRVGRGKEMLLQGRNNSTETHWSYATSLGPKAPGGEGFLLYQVNWGHTVLVTHAFGGIKS